MSPRSRNNLLRKAKDQARIFAALGDETRLTLVAKLVDGEPRSIAQLTQGSQLSRQAITKHLQVLQDAQLVSRLKQGRESRFELDPARLNQSQEYLSIISDQWDNAISRLERYLDKNP